MSKEKDLRVLRLIEKYLPPDFDWQYYLDANPDLVAANIITQYGSEKHYVTYGIREKRKYNDGLAYLNIKNPSLNKTITNYFLDKELDYVNFGGFLISCANLAQMCIKYKWKFYVNYSQSIICDYMQNSEHIGCHKNKTSKNIIDFDNLTQQMPDFQSKKTLLQDIILIGNDSLDIATSFSTLDITIRYRIPKIKLCKQTTKLLKEIIPFGKKINNKFSKFQLWCNNYNVLFASKEITKKQPEMVIDSIIRAYNKNPGKLLIITEDHLFYRSFREEFNGMRSKNKGNIIYLNQLMNPNYDAFVLGLLLDVKIMTQCKKIYYFSEDLESCGIPIFMSSVYDKELINL